MQVVLAIFVLPYYLGLAVSAWLYPRRAGGTLYAYTTAFMHPPSRRNGIPWVIKTIVKVVFWPVVLIFWLRDGRPGPKVLFGEAAAERLGLDPTSLGYSNNGFATKWSADRIDERR